MANEEIKVNGNVYKVTINDQTRMYAMKPIGSINKDLTTLIVLTK